MIIDKLGSCVFIDVDEKKKQVLDFSKNITPKDNRVLVLKLKCVPPRAKRKEIIAIAPRTVSEADSKFCIGVVVSAGHTSTIKKEQYVVFSKWSGLDVASSDGEYLILKDDEVVAIIESVEEYKEKD